MFPHTITLFRLVNDKYTRKVIENVFYLSEKIISQEGNGEKYASTHRCIFPFICDIEKNDIIVKGEVKSIDNIKDLQKNKYDYFLVKTIAKNDYGTPNLQNVEVTD